MLTDDLYQTVLLKPVKELANKLFIVSGYASATFSRRHLLEVLKINKDIKISLIIGMGSNKKDHSAFQELVKNYSSNFKAYYFNGKPEVHAKLYAWYKNKEPFIGYSGSSNYSQFGFFKKMQQNNIIEDNPNEIYDYFNSLISDAVSVSKYKIEEREKVEFDSIEGSLAPGQIEWLKIDESVRISFLSKNGELPSRSGLNWGQRPEFKREPNQAYLSIRSDARKEGFLPEKDFSFTLITDDKKSMDCTVQQDSRKAISTTNDNSELGRYFRERLNVKLGKLVKKEDLINYGRTDFLLKKLDDETFMLDFSNK